MPPLGAQVRHSKLPGLGQGTPVPSLLASNALSMSPDLSSPAGTQLHLQPRAPVSNYVRAPIAGGLHAAPGDDTPLGGSRLGGAALPLQLSRALPLAFGGGGASSGGGGAEGGTGAAGSAGTTGAPTAAARRDLAPSGLVPMLAETAAARPAPTDPRQLTPGAFFEQH